MTASGPRSRREAAATIRSRNDSGGGRQGPAPVFVVSRMPPVWRAPEGPPGPDRLRADNAATLAGHGRTRARPARDQRETTTELPGFAEKVARNFPRPLFEYPSKRCNSNDANARFEEAVGELRAKLVRMLGKRRRSRRARTGFEPTTQPPNQRRVPLGDIAAGSCRSCTN